jgi:NAD(P)-dependent dehydrogenase (short-subunit alcohol dehydrogenase family)
MISGANRGLGNAIARRLHADGYNVSAGARDVTGLADSFGDAERVFTHAYDARVSGSDRAWFDATVDRFGAVDILVNNAGVMDTAPFGELSEDSLENMLNVNVKAPFRLTQIAMPTLRAAGSGRVINIASLSGVRVAGQFAPGYAMSKHAVIALTEATKQAGWADGVRVTAVCPGFIATDMVAELDEDPTTMIQADDLAEMISTVAALPNSASVAKLTVACRLEAHF